MTRHFAGSMTKYLVDHLRQRCPSGSLEEVLGRAGEHRSAEELADESSWSSYQQLRALLEATADVLGGPHQLSTIAVGAMESISSPEFTAALQDLGSPSVLYASIGDASGALTTILDLDAEEVGPAEWLLRNRFHPGFEPFPEYCAFGIGLISVPPMLFGLPPAEVVEEECQTRGAPACAFRVRWAADGGADARADYLAVRAEVTEARLRALQSTAADIVSGGELSDVLARIVRWTGRAVRATGFLLVVDAAPLGGRWIHAEGIPPGQEADLVRALERPGHDGDGHLNVVEVASERGRYGVLAAVNENGRRLFPQESAVLDSHARLAAAALDSASAVDEARRQAATATALLRLSSSLTQLAGVGEMADRVARAIPEVIDCDRASVVLVDPDAPVLRFAGMWGYPPAVEAELRSQVFPGYPGDMPDAVEMWDIREVEHEALRAYMVRSGSAALARVPIYLNGVAAGALLASVTEGPERITRDPSVPERLRGLAAQAGTAVHNARLLDRMRHQAMHDTLTGLPNRALIMDRASQMLTRARRDRRPVAALFVDLDDFKDINDSFGHDVGDSLLEAVAERFTGCLRATDTVGRFGGDEFVVLADTATVMEGIDAVAERLHSALDDPFVLRGARPVSIFVTASIGIAVGDRIDAEELLRMADIALYRAKATGRSRHVLFAPEMESEFLGRVELESQLRTALERGEFFLDYQPIFHLADARVTAAEALIRWRHPVRGVVSPAEFVPSLEETGLIEEVGRWVIHQSCRQAREWARAGHPIGVSVNLSVRQLARPGLVDDVREALEISGLEPGRLTLEITESALMVNAAEAEERLRGLRALGVHLAVDDFGTGYSSLSYLRRFPVDCLKIDRSFVADTQTPEGLALLRVMLGLGRSLGLRTVAEGIETAEQLRLLAGEGCSLGQGYHQARPMEPARVTALLDAQVPADQPAR